MARLDSIRAYLQSKEDPEIILLMHGRTFPVCWFNLRKDGGMVVQYGGNRNDLLCMDWNGQTFANDYSELRFPKLEEDAHNAWLVHCGFEVTREGDVL